MLSLSKHFFPMKGEVLEVKQYIGKKIENNRQNEHYNFEFIRFFLFEGLRL